MKFDARIKILTIDDHPLYCDGIAAVIKAQPDMKLVGEAYTGRKALEAFREHRPDVTLLDLKLQDSNGLDVLTAIRTDFADARIIIRTMFDGDVEIRRALKAGAASYLLKGMSAENLIKTIRRVHSGEKYIPSEIADNLAEYFGNEMLTPRETDVVQLIYAGNRNRDIAEQLFISEGTVKIHIKNIMEKLGAADRTEAVSIALRRGFINL